jgi:long-chain acyl-CoA synthetase
MYTDPALEYGKSFVARPPPGSPHGVALLGTEKEGYTPVYRHWRAGEGELMKTVDPKVRHSKQPFIFGLPILPVVPL